MVVVVFSGDGHPSALFTVGFLGFFVFPNMPPPAATTSAGILFKSTLGFDSCRSSASPVASIILSI